MFKRFMSLTLSFAIFLSATMININVNTVEVSAGSLGTIPSYDVDLSSSLTEGITGVPDYNVGTNTDSESALFDFSMALDPNGSTFEQGTYDLTYPLKDGVIMNMTVEKDSATEAVVTYNLTTSSGSTINYTETGAKPNFTIFASGSQTYENHATYASNGTVESGYYVVNKKRYDTEDSRDANGEPNTAVFHINKGTGYSFQYGGTYVSFLWNANTDEFQFYTKGLSNGNIYDVDLTFTSDSGTFQDISSVFTGMSVNRGTYLGDGQIATNGKFIAAPFANDDHFVNDTVTGSDIPGDTENGIRFGFTAPYTWDGKKYSYTNLSDEYDMNLNMSIGGRTLIINDVFGDLNANVGGTEGIECTSESINDVGQFYVNVKHLPIGVIYENVQLIPQIYQKGTTTPAVKYKSTDVPYGYVFTFPNYEVVQVNSQFYVRLTPFVSNNAGAVSAIKGTYLLKTDGEPSVTQWAETTADVYFPLSISSELNSGEKPIYQIFFNPLDIYSNISNVTFNEYIHSEKYEYEVPIETGDIKAPENFEVVDYSLSAIPGIDKEEEMLLSMEIKYDVATKSQLEKMLASSSTGEINIRYVLSSYLKPVANDTSKKPYTYVDLRIHEGADYEYTDPNTGEIVTTNLYVDYTLSYDEDFTDVFLEINDEKFLCEYRADADTEVYYAQFPFELYVKNVDANEGALTYTPTKFEYPNIYFLTVEAYEIDRDGETGANGFETATGGSVFDSITLNDVSYQEVPPPQNINIDNVTKTSMDVTWDLSAEGLSTYLLDVYTPTELKDIANNIGEADGVNKLDAYYNIYIGTEENFMLDQFSEYPLPDSLNDGDTTRIEYSYNIDADTLANPYELDVLTDNDGSDISAIDVLRQTNGVVMLEHYPIFNEESSTGDYNTDTYTALQQVYSNRTNLDNMLSIVGLDKNEKYYIYVDLVVENQINDNQRAKISSILSPLVGETTLSDTDVPEDKYKVPPSPVLEVDETSVDSAKIKWDPIVVKDSDGNSSEVQYDILRLQGAQMPDKYLTTKESFSTTWEDFVPDNAVSKKGYRTDIGQTENIKEYNESNKSFASTDDAELDETIISLLDNGLSPNQVYFYYVRTVRVTTDEDGNELLVYSNWSRISVTTKNVQSPTNLKINTIYETYDPMSEVVLNFDAPIIDVSKLGISYNLYYTVKEDGGTWSEDILMNPDKLRAGVTSTTDTYTNFNYKVTGLKNGTSYTFKVRMVDNTTGASSLYSNEARAKTDIDQEDYDNGNEIDNWEDYIIDKLMDLINGDYWVVNDTSGQKDIVYREEKFPGVISSSKDRFVTLVIADDTDINNYYIPASSYQLLCDNGMGLKIIYQNTEFYLTPKALTDSLTSAKKDVSDGDISDYYIKLSVSGYASGAINGESTLSDVMTISVSTVGFDTTIKAFEKESYNLLLSLLSTNVDMDDLMDDIEEYVEDGKSALEIQQLVFDNLPDVSDELLDEIGELFEDELSGSKYNNKIEKLDGQMTISLLNADSNVTANAYYSQNGNWALKSLYSYGNMRTLSTYDLGIYVFTGKVLSLPGLDGLPYADNVKDLFIKYGLDAYLGSGSTFSTSQTMTGYMAIGSVAKMMGMSDLEAPVEFLKSKGITASERTSRTDLKAGDMIYYFMAVYENKTGTDIDNINVTNYSATANMTGLNNQNKKAIQVATQVGLIRDPNFNANATMTVLDFLYYLNRLDELVNL